MLEKQFIAIAAKVADLSATDEELALFLFHINSYSKENPQWESLEPQLKALIKTTVEENIMASIQPAVPVVLDKPMRKLKLWPRIVVAAAVSLIALCVYFFKYNGKYTDNVSIVNDIAPGKAGGILTLASGRKIRLSEAVNGELAKEAGFRITKSADGKLIYEIQGTANHVSKLNTLTTAKGETYQLRLPDGSLVWLNAASSLTYATSLNERRERMVELKGEAYFEISKDKAHPFIVKSAGQEVKVLGTHFNVNAYADESAVKTTLLEGSVSVKGRAGTKILKPGQQSELSGGNIAVKDVPADDAVAWKNGYFMFNYEDLESVMMEVARWYNVELKYEDQSIKKEVFFGTISKYENISKVLNMLERTGVAKFRMDNKTIVINKK